MKIALVGSPNSGKTTIFNKLTGSHQKVANWSGVTVDAVIGKMKIDKKTIDVYDLPGIYSLTPFSPDEAVVRNILIEQKFDKIVAVIDVNNIERNLYPIIQLLELKLAPVILVLNMMDEFGKNGYKLKDNILEKILPIKVIPTIATKDVGIDEIKDAIMSFSKKETFHIHHEQIISNFIEKLSNKYEDIDTKLPYGKKWVIEKLLENDCYIKGKLKRRDFYNDLRDDINNFENKYKIKVSERIFENKFGYIKGVVKEVVEKVIDIRSAMERSDSIDRIINNPIIGIPLFLLIMFIVFQLVFKIGTPLQDLVSLFFSWLTNFSTNFFTSVHSPAWVISLINDGIIAGIGSVLIFLPNILILFFSLSFLEDIGYMSRAAFVMDKTMHLMGLHGKSFIPLILGFGCNVPAIMSARILESKKDRIITILINPFISCSARLTIYVLFTGIFFHKLQGLIVFSLYLLGIILAFLSAIIFKRIFFEKEESLLIIELPPFRKPILKNSLLEMWLKTKEFIYKAGTIIFASVIIVWVLSNIPFGAGYASKQSIIGHIGSFFAPIFKPAGFGTWQIAVALIFGFIAKEQVVGILGTLFAASGTLAMVLPNYFTPLTAYSFMVFTLIYTPCLATLSVMKREIGLKWTIFNVIYSLTIAWVFATLIYQIGKLF